MKLITGKSGVGKTTLLESLDIKEVIYMDNWVKNHLYTNDHEVIKLISDEFGEGVISDGAVDTKALGKIVLQDNDQLTKLECIVNPYIHSFLVTHKDNKDIVIEMAIYMKDQAFFRGLFDTVILIKRENITDTKFDYVPEDVNIVRSVNDNIDYDYVINNNEDGIEVAKENLMKILEIA